MELRHGTRMDPERERSLVERAATDPAAFAELYDWYLPRIYAYLVRRVEERTVAEDLTATTFERALRAVRSGTFRNDAFGGWLYRVAGNALVDHVRRGRRYVPLGIRAGDLDDEGGAGRGGPEEAADDHALAAFTATLERDALARAIADLPEGHRRVVVLRYVDGLEGAELADALGCSRPNAAVRLHRALRALRGALQRESTDVA
jgi:RNA polymerase sigma-70 factor, ECF subfamily